MPSLSEKNISCVDQNIDKNNTDSFHTLPYPDKKKDTLIWS